MKFDAQNEEVAVFVDDPDDPDQGWKLKLPLDGVMRLPPADDVDELEEA